MPTTFSRASALSAIHNEQLGFSFGKPLRASEKSLAVVLPILRETTAKRQYVTLPEIQDKVDIRDTGFINRFSIRNESDENAFIRFGTIFAGKTQERALLRSAVVFANSSAQVEVRCVHASRGINADAKTTHGGLTPMDIDQRIYGPAFGLENATQQRVWDIVNTVSRDMLRYTSNANLSNEERERLVDAYRRLASLSNQEDERLVATGGSRRASVARHSRADTDFPEEPARLYEELMDRERSRSQPIDEFLTSPDRADMSMGRSALNGFAYSDDLAGSMADFSRNFDAVIKGVPLQEHQAGFALITPIGVESIETFDSELSWKAIHEDSVKRVGTKLVDQEKASVFEYKPEKAREVVKAVLAKEYRQKLIWEHKPSNGDPSVVITGLSADGYTGEVVEVDGRVIHLAILRMA